MSREQHERRMTEDGEHNQRFFSIRRFNSWSRLWPEAAAALAPILVFWRLIFAGQVLYWGLPILQFVPWRTLANDALRSGRLPLWTPLLGMGAPLLANHQSAVLYPPNWLALIISPQQAVSILAVLHLSFAGVGMARLARKMGLADFGAAVAGLSFGLSGYLTGRLWFITINNAAAWLPWIVLCAPVRSSSGQAAGSGSYRSRLSLWLMLSGLIALQLLAGHAQTSFYTLLLAAAWTLWQAAQKTPRLAEMFRAGLSFALAAAFALGLTAVQIIPTVELLGQTPRFEAAGYEFAVTYSLWPWRLITLIAPDFFGHPADHNYWGYATYWEDHAYVGLLPLTLAVFAAAAFALGRGKDRGRVGGATVYSGRGVAFLLIVAALSLILALGKNAPVFPFFYRYVPGFGLFQAPARMLIWFTFAVCLLAGIGADRWITTERKRYGLRLAVAGALATAAIGAAAASASNARVATFGSGMARAAVLGAAAAGVLLFRPERPRHWPLAAVGLIVFDLGLAAARLNPTADPNLYQLKPSIVSKPFSGRVFHSADDEYQIKFGQMFRFSSFDPLDAQALRDSLLPNMSALDGTATANNFDPLLPERYGRFIAVMESNPRLLDLADVQAIVKPGGILQMRPPGTSRLRIVYEARFARDDTEALAAVTDPAFDPDKQVVIESDPSSSPEGPALPLDPQPHTAAVNLDRDGYVVLSDAFYPGWRVYVDGEPRPLLRGDYLFRAVAVPQGSHVVLFEYAPASVTAGLLLSVSAGVLWFILLIWDRRRKQRYA